MRFIKFGLGLTVLLSLTARADKQAKLEAVTSELKQDMVYYRWQSDASGRNLDALKIMNQKTNEYFMSMKSGIASGPGIYMAVAPKDATEFLPSGGNLLEVHIPKGTRYVDFTNPKTAEKMVKYGFTSHNFTGKRSFKNQPVLIKYADTWLVGRDLTGIAKFHLFPGPEMTPAQAKEILAPVTGRARVQMTKQLNEIRPELRRQIVREGGLKDDVARSLMTKEEQIEDFKKMLEAKDKASKAAVNNLLVERRAVGEIVTQLDPETRTQLRQWIMKNVSPPRSPVVLQNFPAEWRGEYILKHGLDFENSPYVVSAYFHGADLKGGAQREQVAHILDLVKKQGSVEAKYAVTDALMKRSSDLLKSGDSPRAVHEMIEELGLPKNSETKSIVKEVDRRDQLFRKIEKLEEGTKIQPSDVQAALKSAKDVSEFRAVVRAARAHDVNKVIQDHPELYLKVLQKESKDPSNLAKQIGENWLSIRRAGVDVSKATLQLLKSLPSPDRERVIADAVSVPNSKFAELLSAHKDEVLEGVKNFRTLRGGLEVALSHDEDQLVLWVGAMLRHAKTPDDVRGIEPERFLINKKSILDRIEKIGWEKFRAEDVVDSLNGYHLTSVERKKIYEHLIKNASNPYELNFVAGRMADDKFTYLAPELVRRFKRLKPNSDEIEELKEIFPRVVGVSKLKPESNGFDCVASWSRALDSFPRP